MLHKLIPFTLVAGLLSVAALAADPPWMARSHAGMVASDSPEASRIGAGVLTGGGNAFDAAIATSFALAVSRPQSTGLGGGGFLVAWLAKDQRVVVLDFRETAPAGATAERYAELFSKLGDGPSPTVYGGNAVAIPGQLAGLAEIQKRFATRPLRELVQPALELAETGFAVDEHYLDASKEALTDFAKWPQLKEQYKSVYETLLAGGTPRKAGDKVTRFELASALRLIADQGADAFYKGPIGEAAVAAVKAAGGNLTLEDLAGYRVREREPLRARYHDYEIVTMPPPSSGGVCIVETLNILDALVQKEHTNFVLMRREGRLAPTLVVAFKHSFADRARWLGDSDFARVPTDRLISPAYAGELVERDVQSLDEFGTNRWPSDRGTSHFCVADKDGNVVALTETINGVFGSLVVAEPYGIVLNNEMDDFTAALGEPNLYGLVQGEANAIAPGKRPLSSMSPTIVFKHKRPFLALGGSGGPRIITSVAQVLVSVLDYQAPLEEAMSAIRIHHQWRPDEVYLDREPPAALVAELQAANNYVSATRKVGVVQAIQMFPDGLIIGTSDPRKGGRPAGVK